MANIFEKLIDDLIKDTAENRTYLKSIAESLQLRKAEETPRILSIQTMNMESNIIYAVGQLVGSRKTIFMTALTTTHNLFLGNDRNQLKNAVELFNTSSTTENGNYYVWDTAVVSSLSIEVASNLYIACPGNAATITYYEVGYESAAKIKTSHDEKHELRNMIHGG